MAALTSMWEEITPGVDCKKAISSFSVSSTIFTVREAYPFSAGLFSSSCPQRPTARTFPMETVKVLFGNRLGSVTRTLGRRKIVAALAFFVRKVMVVLPSWALTSLIFSNTSPVFTPSLLVARLTYSTPAGSLRSISALSVRLTPYKPPLS